MSTPVKRKITLELNPNKKVLPKDRPSVFQRLGTKKFQTATGGSGPVKQHQEQETTINKEEIVKRIVSLDEPEPVPPPKIVPESVSAHARIIEAQLAAKLGKVIVSRGETIGAIVGSSNVGSAANRNEAERGSVGVTGGGGVGGGGGHSGTSAIERGAPGGGSTLVPSVGGSGGGGWDQSSLENADQDILERKRKELQHELKLEMDASGGGSSHHHHHHHSSSSMIKQKSGKETLVVKKVRKVPAPRRSSSSSDSSSSSGSDSSDSDSSSSSSSSSRDSRRVKKRTIRQRRDSSSSSDGGGGKKVIKKHVKKVSADGTKRIVTKKIGGHLTKIRVKKVTSPGGTTSHIRKVAREVSPSGKTPTKYTVKKVVALKKDKHAVVVDARERVREKERELAHREKEREREKERLRLREREREREQVKSRSPRSHLRSRSPRARLSPIAVTVRGREKKKSPEGSRYREPAATVIRRVERSPERVDDRRRHETLKDRERRERQERGELVRTKEREEALARCQERQRERERLAAAKDRSVPRRERDSQIDGGLDKPDRHRPVERLLPRPAERARALAAARSPGKIDHDRSRTPNSPRARDRLAPRDRSYDRVAERGFIQDHHDRRTRSREREYVTPIVQGSRSRDSPYDRHTVAPSRDAREYREAEPRSGYDRERDRSQDYGRTEYPDDPPPRRELDREWERNREPDRGPPAQRTYERREDHGRDWERDHCRPSHSHNHESDSYQGSSRAWEESRWKEADGWVNEKERNEWKFKERSWEHDDHPAVGPPAHSHNHSSGRRWQHAHAESSQGSNWHGKPKEDMEFGPRNKLAGRLGDRVGNDNTMFRRPHLGHQAMFQRQGRNGPPAGMASGRFANVNKYSINRTQQNLASQHQHSHPYQPAQQRQPQEQESHSIGPGSGPGPSNAPNQSQPVPSMTDSSVQTPAQKPTSVLNDPKDNLPTPTQTPEAVEETQNQASASTAGVASSASASVDSATTTITAPTENVESTDEKPTTEPEEKATPAAAVGTVDKPPESAVVPPEPMDEDSLSEISDDPDDILTREEDDFIESSQVAGESSDPSKLPGAPATVLNSSSMMIPSQVLQNHAQPQPQQQQQQSQNQQQPAGPRRPFLSKARYKSYDGCIGGPVQDLYANIDDFGTASFRNNPGEITNQLNDSTGAADGKPSTGDSNVQDNSMSAGYDAPQAGSSDASGNATAAQGEEVKDPKEAGKLHANKELKEEMDLDFEEISDGELEEENKFKGLGDALGVDWASLAQETRAKLKPEQTIPVSARNRWKAHHILLDIGISVRLAGEAYAQRVLTESKEKLREEIEEFKAAAEQQKVAAIKKEEEEQQLFNGVKIKKEILDEEERKEQQAEEAAVKTEESNENVSEQEANLADIDKILHPVASVHVAMRERARARRNLILCAAGPHSRALSARRDLEIRRQLCGFPPQECNERITEHQSTPTNPELHETVMKLYQATMQQKKIEVQ